MSAFHEIWTPKYLLLLVYSVMLPSRNEICWRLVKGVKMVAVDPALEEPHAMPVSAVRAQGIVEQRKTTVLLLIVW